MVVRLKTAFIPVKMTNHGSERSSRWKGLAMANTDKKNTVKMASTLPGKPLNAWLIPFIRSAINGAKSFFFLPLFPDLFGKSPFEFSN